MHRIFAGMAVWAVVLLLAEFALGVLTRRVQPALVGWHLAFGVFVAIYVCVLHVMVMFHFIGSGKEMKEHARILGDHAEILRRLRRLKMQVMPAATFAPVFIMAGAILGGGAHTKALGGWAWIHWALALAGLLLNLYVFPIEYRCLKANLELLHEVDERIRREISPALESRIPQSE
jgi:divalent metal cation (Fe/Co/Zn/Cd) transporter